jgi:hypothetical protein
MLIAVFRKNYLSNSLLLLPFAALIRVFSLIYPDNSEMIRESGVLYRPVVDILADHPFLTSVVSIFIVFFIAANINRLMIRNRIANEITLLPGLFFIILVSLTPEQLALSPLHIGSFFIVLAMFNLFKTYKKFNCEIYLFNAGFYIGIAAMFCNSMILFFIPVFLGFLSIRSFNFREFLQLLSGLALIFYFFAFYGIWAGESLSFDVANIASVKELFAGGPSFFIIAISSIVLTVIVLLTHRSFIIKKSIQSQNKVNILFWYLLLCFVLIWFFDPMLRFGYSYLIAFGLSYFTSAIFLRLKNKMLLEIVYVVIIFSILIYHFNFYY